jgi:tetratricopeptide (TPR) repeat protein
MAKSAGKKMNRDSGSPEHYPLPRKEPASEQAALLARAISLHRHGRTDAAEPLYLDVLREAPRNADACTCWASSRRSGTTIKPDYADAHYNRGNVLQSINRQEEALAAYDQALAIAPGHSEALNNRSNVLIHLNRLEDALASYDQALALAPHQAELHYNRGNVLQGFGASR